MFWIRHQHQPHCFDFKDSLRVLDRNDSHQISQLISAKGGAIIRFCFLTIKQREKARPGIDRAKRSLAVVRGFTSIHTLANHAMKAGARRNSKPSECRECL
jgi:hypothetical protein